MIRKHGTKLSRKRRPRPRTEDGRRFHDTPRWRRLRAVILARDKRTCADPYGVHPHAWPGDEVDHVVPLRVDRARAYDANNLQVLCKACHARKTGEEQREAAKARENSRIDEGGGKCMRGKALGEGGINRVVVRT